MLSFLASLFFIGSIVYLALLKLAPKYVAASLKQIVTIVGLVALLFLLKPFEIVPAGSKGLLFTLGAINDKVISPGIVFKWPFIQEVKCVSLRPIQVDMRVDVGSNGAITKDNQTIGVTLVFFYRYKDDQLVQMYSKYGEDKIKSIITTSGLESFKTDIGNYDIFNVAMKQEEIRKNTYTMLKEKMANYPIEVTELKITNYDWSDEFDKQIAETMHRAQQVKQKEQELLVTEQEAQKKVKTAEADKQALITTAEGEKAAAQLRADAKALEGDGIRKYNEAVQRNMELEIKLRQLEIERIKAERWNGEYVPTNNYGPIPVQTGALKP